MGLTAFNYHRRREADKAIQEQVVEQPSEPVVTEEKPKRRGKKEVNDGNPAD